MNTVRLCLVGAKGRMGRAIIAAAETEEVAIVAQLDQGDDLTKGIVAGNAVVDFSHASAAPAVTRACLDAGKPLVIGTTGHSRAERAAIEQAANSLPIILSANFSVGVNALFWLSRKAAELLGENFEVEIVETHHALKKDAPSGTAKTLAAMLKEARATKGEIAIQSMREGEIVGDHTVIFSGAGERVELTHRASSREIFAKGALRAARWIVGRPPGLYSMEDVLGLPRE